MGEIPAATGHRPNKLGGYGAEVDVVLRAVATLYLKPRRAKTEHAISGMALGWDMAWAEACVALGISFIAAVPFVGQERVWPDPSQQRYQQLLQKAKKVVVVCSGGYAPEKMQRRNEWMIDRCTEIAALWDGTPGGTANCLRYANRPAIKRPVVNLWPEFMKLRRG